MLVKEDVVFLCQKESARKFHAGGVPILKLTSGDPSDRRDVHGLTRYNKQPVVFAGNKYLISHELYNKPNNPSKDSRQPLIEYLVTHGLAIETIFQVCLDNKNTKH